MATDLSQLSDAELEAMAAQRRAAAAPAPQPPTTQVPGYAAPLVAPALPFLALSDMARGKVQAAPPAPPAPSSFPPIQISEPEPDPTYNAPAGYRSSYPVGAEIGRFGTQVAAGLGKFATDLPLMGQQAANVISQYGPINQAIDSALPLPFGIAARAIRAYGGQLNPAELKAAIEEKRQTDEPLASSAGGKIGRLLGGTAAMAALGPSVPAVAAGGSLLGMSELTSDPSQLATNVGIGGATALASQALANKIGGWAARRADEPLTGWTKGNMNQRFADAVGAKSSDALDILDRRSEMGAIFDKYRSPDVTAQIPQGTGRIVDEAAAEAPTIDPKRFKNIEIVRRVLDVGKRGQATTEELGALTSELGQKAWATKSNELADAYYHLEDYLQDRILSTITDPAGRAEYLGTMKQYGVLKRVVSNPNMYKGSTGEVNFQAIGNMLQKQDTWGFLGRDQSPYYQAARAGQAEGITPKPPEELLKRAGHAIKYSPATGAIGGLAARGMNYFPQLGPAGLEAGLTGTALSGWNLATAQGQKP